VPYDCSATTNEDTQISLIWLSDPRECFYKIRVRIAADGADRLCFPLLMEW
jgi:hypothetical protein